MPTNSLSRIYGSLAQSVSALPPDQVAAFKANAIKTLLPGTLTWLRGTTSITISNPSISSPGTIQVQATATKGASPVNLGDGIFQYHNPPLMFPTGQTVTISTPIKPVTVNKMQENALEAFKEIVGQTVDAWIGGKL